LQFSAENNYKKLRRSKKLALQIGNASDLQKSVLETSKELKMNITVLTNVFQPLSHARISKIIFKSLETPTYKNVQRPGKK
jgi:hypothetical protein